ncbi:MAG: hypothetical protein WHS44_03440 [Fimbriimonadales bacterium]|nr:MAG: hypothetical protein KatS3mg018_1849 [Fimbriimonadales bacterium]
MYPDKLLRWVRFGKGEPGCNEILNSVIVIGLAYFTGAFGKGILLPLVGTHLTVWIITALLRAQEKYLLYRGDFLKPVHLILAMVLSLALGMFIGIWAVAYLAHQPAWQTLGKTEMAFAALGFIVSAFDFLRYWLILFFTPKVDLLVVLPRVTITLIMMTFLVGAFALYNTLREAL